MANPNSLSGLLIAIAVLLCVPAKADEGSLAYVLQFPASVGTVLVAETSTATLHRYSARGDRLQVDDAQPMSIGQNGVAKQRSGDRRTPLGVYFVVEELDTKNLHEKYGPVAFPLDYPNAWDTRSQRSGHGIWIHGVTPGSGPRPTYDTDGCIALPNDRLLSLGPHLKPMQTPVIVTRKIETRPDAEITATRDSLLAALEQWTNSYRDGDWHQYLSLYSKEFAYRGMNYEEWTAYRMLTTASRSIEDFSISDILLLADPEEPGLYLSRFRQQITESGRTIATSKRLYWRVTPAGDYRIVAEDNG